MDPLIIEKEEVGALKFPASEVLSSPELIEQRAKQLNKALSLGNLDKIKVKIEFEDEKSIRVVHTTIWAVTEFNIILKSHVTIPRNRIHRIEFTQVIDSWVLPGIQQRLHRRKMALPFLSRSCQ